MKCVPFYTSAHEIWHGFSLFFHKCFRLQWFVIYLWPLVFHTLIENELFLITFFYFDVYSEFSMVVEELEDTKLFLHCIF